MRGAQSVPAEASGPADKVRDDILGGYSPFVGPLTDSSGTVRVEAGKRMTEQELYNWDWAVEGVSGLPSA